MAIVKKDNRPKSIVIDLTGPEGNVFALMNYATKWSKSLSIDGDAIVADMMSSDYEHAVQVMDDNFGSFVTFLK